MKHVRMGVFETNSSSTHALVLGSKEEYDLFCKGELAADIDSSRFVTPATNEEKDSGDWDGYQYMHKDVDWEHTEYTTPKGDIVVGISFEYPC
jgi:hypothetical protein